MDKKNSVYISDMLNRLQAIEHYPNPKQAFDALLYGWRKRNGIKTETMHFWRKRDWMTRYYARSFAEYCGYPIDRKEG